MINIGILFILSGILIHFGVFGVVGSLIATGIVAIVWGLIARENMVRA